jgi:hypothetical protein
MSGDLLTEDQAEAVHVWRKRVTALGRPKARETNEFLARLLEAAAEG